MTLVSFTVNIVAFHIYLQKCTKMIFKTCAAVTDIVALIGDLTDGSVKRHGDAAVSLKSMKAHIGKYFVSGMQQLCLTLSEFNGILFHSTVAVALSYFCTYIFPCDMTVVV